MISTRVAVSLGPMSDRPHGGPGGSQFERSRAGIPSTISPEIRPGLVLYDTYRLVRPLGEGAMGVVYLGRDERLERDVAIKFVRPEQVKSEEEHERLLREARTMARIRHLNVVEVYAYGELAGAPYFVMEYVPGDTVEGWLRHRRGKLLSVDEALGILDQVCRGVTAIHRAGAVHRDLKPSNVLVGPGFRMCVTDLGLARLLDYTQRETSDTVSGTPAYMAPEIVLGTPLPREFEARADVYSLGVMAFELLTGRLPFEYDDASKMMLAHVETSPPVPSDLRDELPPAFDRVLLEALEKDPHVRTASADVLRRALFRARETAGAKTQALSFLVADDDADFRGLVIATLRTVFPGAEVLGVDDGAEALSLLERRPVSLAILDLDMPRMNGVELTAALRATPGLERMSIIVVTASGGAPDWRLLQSLGANGFLVKPIDPRSLVAFARRALDEP